MKYVITSEQINQIATKIRNKLYDRSLKEGGTTYTNAGDIVFNAIRDNIVKVAAELQEKETVGEFTIEDIYSQAEERGIKLTEEQGLDIMNYLQHNFDANIGINWDVISLAIKEIANRG